MNIYKLTFTAIKGRLRGTHTTYVVGETEWDAKLNFYEHNNEQIRNGFELNVVAIEVAQPTGEYIRVLY